MTSSLDNNKSESARKFEFAKNHSKNVACQIHSIENNQSLGRLPWDSFFGFPVFFSNVWRNLLDMTIYLWLVFFQHLFVQDFHYSIDQQHSLHVHRIFRSQFSICGFCKTMTLSYSTKHCMHADLSWQFTFIISLTFSSVWMGNNQASTIVGKSVASFRFQPLEALICLYKMAWKKQKKP